MTISVTNIVREVSRYLEERYSSGDVRIIVVDAPPSFGGDRTIRVSWEYRGITAHGEYRNMVLDMDTFLFMGRSEIDTAIYVAREFTRGIEEDRREFMAQWNRRRSQQLQDQERQRREARGQTTAEAAVEWVESEPQAQRSVRPFLGDFIANQLTPPRWLTDRLDNQTTYTDTHVGMASTTTLNTATTGTGFMYNTANGLGGASGPVGFGAGGGGVSGSNTGNGMAGGSYVRENVLTYNAAEEMFKRLIQEKLDSLDIRISLDESDGEVSAEVEVVLDGRVIASDSDTITIG